MVGMMAASSRGKIASRINSIKYGGAADIAWKLEQLRRLRNELVAADSMLVMEFLSLVLDLLSDSLSPVRKFITQMLGQIGLKHLELLPEIIPALMDLLKDDTPAVARQAITCGVDIFRSSLAKVAIQGLHSSDSNESVKLAWTSVLKLKDEIYSMAFKVGSDGRRLPALKFVESVVLLYTSDPNGLLEPPANQVSEGMFDEFNVSWVRGGHPILNVGDLSVEASQSLRLLLDQLRFPSLKSHSNLMVIVLIKSLSAIATKRPAFYGRILPVLLGLVPSSSTMRGMHLTGVHHALKNAFENCLNCSHPGAAPWRDRLVNALKEIKFGKPAEQTAKEICNNNGSDGWKDDLHVAHIHEDPNSSVVVATESGSAGRKRTGVLDMSDLTEHETPPKRERLTPESSEKSGLGVCIKQDGPTTGTTRSRLDEDNGPVQALVTLFGSLVAQGEKAVASLEILISSISADLLTEVVMANMRNLPPNCPKSEGAEDLNMSAHPDMIGSNTHLKKLSLLLTDALSKSRSSIGEETGVEHPRDLILSEIEQTREEEPLGTMLDSDDGDAGLSSESQLGMESIAGPVFTENVPSAMEIASAVTVSVENENKVVEDEIPGLTISTQDDVLPESMTVLSNSSIDLGNTSKELFPNLGQVLVGLSQSLSTDRSDELSPKATLTDATSMNSSTATSVVPFPQLILPKISAPVLCVADEQKDQLQELAFSRIVDAYQQVRAAGGSEVRFSILAHSGLEFPSELDPWKLLRTHILSDYVNHEGHELTLRVLYRLFREAEEDRDFFSSTTATSVYETFLIQVAETLKDSFSTSDKSLSRLLEEVPYLPKSIFEMLEHLCSPGTSDNDDKDLHGGDLVTPGLMTVWKLILFRPPAQDACLKIALKSATHHLEKVRMKAIRLVANKLYPLSSISKKIEEYAKEMLLSVASGNQSALTKDADGADAEIEKDAKDPSADQSLRPTTGDISSDTHLLSASKSIPSSTMAEVQRCMSLYFALCTKKHSLLRQIFDIYHGASKVAKQAVHSQIPLLVRTTGSSRDLLDIISDPPSGSEGLVIQVVRTLTDGTVPSPDLIYTIKRLFDTKMKDLDILIPILPFLQKDEVLVCFPHLVNAPLDKFQAALSRIVEGLNQSAPVLTPAEALIAIHGIDPDRDGIPLKKVTDACNACFEQRQIFSQPVLAKVLNQLVEQIPLPMLFMRTVLQAIGAFPPLVEFIMEILSRLVSKQIWKYPKLWVGFMKCALLTKPQSFGVLLQLPSAQLENVMNRTPALKAPLVAHASQPHIRSTLPRSTLVVLGIVSETQTSTQPPSTQTQTGPVSEPQPSAQSHSTQSQAGETGVQETEGGSEMSKEASAAN